MRTYKTKMAAFAAGLMLVATGCLPNDNDH
jgi:hypothetical protein